MRKLFGIFTSAALLLATAGAADAALTTRTAKTTLLIGIQGVGTVPVSGTGTVTVDTTTGGALFLKKGAGIVNLASDLSVPITGTTAIKSIIAKAGLGNDAGTLSLGRVTSTQPAEVCSVNDIELNEACVTGGSLGGSQGLIGTVSVNLGALTIPLALGDSPVGRGGTAVIPNTAGGFFFDGAPMTLGSGLVQFQTTTILQTDMNMQFTTPIRNTTITQTLTVASQGTVQTAGGQVSQLTLVTPTFVDALGNALPVFVRERFEFQAIPEPGTLLLIGTGVAGLALLGRRRR